MQVARLSRFGCSIFLLTVTCLADITDWGEEDLGCPLPVISCGCLRLARIALDVVRDLLERQRAAAVF